MKSKVFLLNPIGSRGPLKVLGALSMFSFQVSVSEKRGKIIWWEEKNVKPITVYHY